MSQYLSITYKLIYCISINFLIASSESNNQSFQISDSNQSIILNKNLDSNSYYYIQNGLLVKNSTNISYESGRKNFGRYIGKNCDFTEDCDTNEKCCNKKCINKWVDCKGMRV